MATSNVNSPKGLQPVRSSVESSGAGAVNEYLVPAASASTIKIGDAVVEVDETGNFKAMGVDLAAVGGPITGVCVGINGRVKAGSSNEAGLFSIAVSNLPAQRVPDGFDYYISVNDNPQTLYEITCNGPLPMTAIGQTANLVLGEALATSGSMLDVGTVTKTGGQLKIIRFASQPNNFYNDPNPVVEVKIVKATEGDDQAGI